MRGIMVLGLLLGCVIWFLGAHQANKRGDVAWFAIFVLGGSFYATSAALVAVGS